MGRTMVGVSAGELPVGVGASFGPKQDPPRASFASTARGATSLAPAAPDAPAAAPARAPAPSSPFVKTASGPGAPVSTAAAPVRPPAKKAPAAGTMIGLPQSGIAHPAVAPTGPATPAAPAPVPAAAPRKSAARTMLGMIGGGSAVAPMPAAQAAPVAPAAPAPPVPVQGGRTMLHGAAGALAPAAPAPAATPSLASRGGATMLGVPQAGADVAASPRIGVQTEMLTMGDAPARPPARTFAIAGAVVVLALLAGGAWLWMRPAGPPPVQVRITGEPGAESLEFDVAGVAAGSRIRFGGQEKPLEAGRARFALASDSLRVGDNTVLVDVVDPDGEAHPARITLGLDYRLVVDISPLEAGKPSVDVVVTARPGSTVMLDGTKLDLDGQGRGVRTDEIDIAAASAAGSYEHVVRYRIEPPAGEAHVGEQKLRLSITSLHIDRPGESLITDKDAVEIAGAVTKETTVAIDGTPVTVQEGRFLHRYLMLEPGDYTPKIVATERGKVPVTRTLRVKRVADLAEAAKAFDPQPGLTYAKIAPNPFVYRGRRVEIEGRVYNVSVQGGRSVLQIFARECPGGQHCSLWVTYPAATDLTAGNWVRVLGTIEGEQQFRAESDTVVRVPKIDAVYLLPAEP